MMFDPSISAGTILNAIALLIGFAIAFTRIGGRIDLLSQRMAAVEEAVKATNAIRSQIDTMAERLNAAQRDIAELKQHKGRA